MSGHKKILQVEDFEASVRAHETMSSDPMDERPGIEMQYTRDKNRLMNYIYKLRKEKYALMKRVSRMIDY